MTNVSEGILKITFGLPVEFLGKSSDFLEDGVLTYRHDTKNPCC
jgi:hypothetical protein